MTPEQIKAALSEKITTRERLVEIMKQAGIVSRTQDLCFGQRYVQGRDYHRGWDMSDMSHRVTHDSNLRVLLDEYRYDVTTAVPEHMWWLLRERLRMIHGVYPEHTEPLMRIFKMRTAMNYCVHISTQDPQLVAYTPSATDGEADKQVRLSLGKFLKKVFLSMSDAEIQAIEAEHRADMTNELELVTGAAEIQKVYTGMTGDSGCMRYQPSHWSLPQDVHPSIVYDAPGFAVAVMRDNEGKVKARSVVWTNPEDPSDKRYIRIYGDGALKRRLERNGYVCKHLGGAMLRRVDWPGYRQRDGVVKVVMPYIDGPGGNGNCSRMHGRFAVLADNGIRLVDRDERDEIVNALSDDTYVPGLSNQAGYVLFKPLPANWTHYTCALSGQSVSRKESAPVRALVDGRLVEASKREVASRGFVEREWARTEGDAYGGKVWTPADFPTFVSPYTYHSYPDTPEQRKAHNFGKLDAAFYPDEQDWVLTTNDDYVVTHGYTGSGGLIKRADARMVVQMVDGDEAVCVMHKDAVPTDATKLWRKDGKPTYAAAGITFHTTPSRCKVHPSIHDVEKLWDGTYEFERNVQTIRLFGCALKVNRNFDRTELDVATCDPLKAYFKIIARRGSTEALKMLRRYIARDVAPYEVRNGQVAGTYSTTYEEPQNERASMEAAIAAIEAATDDQLSASGSVPAARWWARTVKAILAMYDADRAEYEAERATAQASASASAVGNEQRFATARFSLAA